MIDWYELIGISHKAIPRAIMKTSPKCPQPQPEKLNIVQILDVLPDTKTTNTAAYLHLRLVSAERFNDGRVRVIRYVRCTTNKQLCDLRLREH